MILDSIANVAQLHTIHPLFGAAFDFLTWNDFNTIEDGRYPIEGDHVYALISTGPGRPRNEAPLEVHRRYIDIQYVISGTEEMGWRSLPDCIAPKGAYDPVKDIMFFRDDPACWIVLAPRMFVVFFPSDAHAPLIADHTIRKAVVKVAV